LVVCNGCGFWVRAKQDSSASIPTTTSTTNKDEIDSDKEDLIDDIQVVSQPSQVNNLSNSIASSAQPLAMENHANINNDDDDIASKTSINEEPDNLSIDIVDNWSMDVIDHLDSATGDSIQQHIGDGMKKSRSIVKLMNKSSILMVYVLNLKKQFKIHRSLQLGCKSRWNSSYNLVEAM
jgi:hypothetical protein